MNYIANTQASLHCRQRRMVLLVPIRIAFQIWIPAPFKLITKFRHKGKCFGALKAQGMRQGTHILVPCPRNRSRSLLWIIADIITLLSRWHLGWLNLPETYMHHMCKIRTSATDINNPRKCYNPKLNIITVTLLRNRLRELRRCMFLFNFGKWVC